uniref:Uncharacterized protein n=1 Tax=Solanum lycopersicum TaxID=4081 RepID=A0A3Q7H8F2_SOLLC
MIEVTSENQLFFPWMNIMKKNNPHPPWLFLCNFTCSVKKAIDEGLILMADKNQHSSRGKPFFAVDDSTIHDDNSTFDITQKGKRKMVLPTHKKQVRRMVEKRGLVDESSDNTVFESRVFHLKL